MIYSTGLYSLFFVVRLFMIYLVQAYLTQHYGCPQLTVPELAVGLTFLEALRNGAPPTAEQMEASTDPTKLTVFVILASAHALFVCWLVLFAL